MKNVIVKITMIFYNISRLKKKKENTVTNQIDPE